MAVIRKPRKPGSPPARRAPTVNVAALINKGGAAPQSASQVGEKAIMQRLPVDILSRVDAAVAARRVRTSRNTWIIEAILDKLEAAGF